MGLSKKIILFSYIPGFIIFLLIFTSGLFLKFTDLIKIDIDNIDIKLIVIGSVGLLFFILILAIIALKLLFDRYERKSVIPPIPNDGYNFFGSVNNLKPDLENIPQIPSSRHLINIFYKKKGPLLDLNVLEPDLYSGEIDPDGYYDLVTARYFNLYFQDYIVDESKYGNKDSTFFMEKGVGSCPVGFVTYPYLHFIEGSELDLSGKYIIDKDLYSIVKLTPIETTIKRKYYLFNYQIYYNGRENPYLSSNMYAMVSRIIYEARHENNEMFFISLFSREGHTYVLFFKYFLNTLEIELLSPDDDSSTQYRYLYDDVFETIKNTIINEIKKIDTSKSKFKPIEIKSVFHRCNVQYDEYNCSIYAVYLIYQLLNKYHSREKVSFDEYCPTIKTLNLKRIVRDKIVLRRYVLQPVIARLKLLTDAISKLKYSEKGYETQVKFLEEKKRRFAVGFKEMTGYNIISTN